MSDFCLDCGQYLFGDDYTMNLPIEEDEVMEMLCEGCGENILVTNIGKRIDKSGKLKGGEF